jgi:hypothetical protein
MSVPKDAARAFCDHADRLARRIAEVTGDDIASVDDVREARADRGEDLCVARGRGALTGTLFFAPSALHENATLDRAWTKDGVPRACVNERTPYAEAQTVRRA